MRQLLAALELPAGIEKREAGRRPASTGRAVDLAVGEDGDVPLTERRALVDPLEEDDAVDVAELRLERMDELLPGLELTFDLAAELDQTRQGFLLHRERRLDGRVESAAKGDVDGQAPGLERLCLHIGGHVREADSLDASFAHRSNRFEPPGGHVHDDLVSGSTAAIKPLSSAHVTSAIVPCPQAVE